MALAEHGAGGDVLLLRLLDRVAHRLVADVVAEAPVAIDDGGGVGFLRDRPGRLRHDVPDLDAVDIGGDQDDPVAVMADQVGADIVFGDDLGLVLRRAGSHQQAFGDFHEFFG